MKRLSIVFLGSLGLAACSSGDPCRDALDPNHDPASAATLTAGKTQSGLKACAGDEDWFSVTLAAGDTLSVHAAVAGGATDALALSVHEPSADSPIAAAVFDGDGLTVQSQPGAAGTYHVRVLGIAERTGYGLTATVTPATTTCAAGSHAQNGGCVVDGCDDLGLEPNEDVTGARRIVPGVYHGLRACAGDADWYVVSAPPGGGALQVALTNVVDGDVDVYATDGTMNGPIPNMIGVGQTGGTEEHLTNVPIAAGGEVYIYVTGGTARYDMEVSFTALDTDRDCMSACREIIAYDGPLDPGDPAALAAGYYDGSPPEYLFARRDFVMYMKWAFKQTAEHCPGTHPVYVSDIGQADGKVPGTDVGQPRHPPDAHINGHDADIAYFQTLPDNDYRIICGDGSDTNGNGQPGKFNDGYFCTTDQNVIDWPRQAYFLAMMAENPNYHVTGVDQTLPDQFYAAADKLAAAGEIPARAAYKIDTGGLAFGNRDLWPFHHHHIHTQEWNPNQPRLPLYYDGYF